MVQNPEHWAEYLMKWLVGVVANALNDVGCQNHVCLVPTGEQGKFKTTWLDNLCPRPLKSYIFTGKLDPQNKDVLTLIAECLFINIDDQLKALNKRDENEHSKRFHLENGSLKLDQDKEKPENIRLTVNGASIHEWFRQKQQEFLHSIGINPPKQNNKVIKR